MKKPIIQIEIMEKTFTRQELINAQIKLNKEFLYNPESFTDITQDVECAEMQIDNLITRVK
ncbi:hypothetical protein [Aquimarina megaterium]|uniref:hypothetical protein n=1 Tax=Aquimarina megaterium TaxID=1443666 RepID=UPI0009442E0A|nr:hypothetical protein [Aquimarina megaterium]